MPVQKLSAAAIAIGLVAGGVSCQVETSRAEQPALEHAAKGARHFDSSIVPAIVDAKTTGKHAAPAEALSIIARDSGRQFDPRAVAIFREIVPDLYLGAAQAGDAELRQEMRVVLSRYLKTDAAPEGAASRSGESVG